VRPSAPALSSGVRRRITSITLPAELLAALKARCTVLDFTAGAYLRHLVNNDRASPAADLAAVVGALPASKFSYGRISVTARKVAKAARAGAKSHRLAVSPYLVALITRDVADPARPFVILPRAKA